MMKNRCENRAAILQHEGYECLTVPSGVDALRLIEAGEKFDLVPSDICNESMSGSDFLNQIKQRYPDIPTPTRTACWGIPRALRKSDELTQEQGDLRL